MSTHESLHAPLDTSLFHQFKHRAHCDRAAYIRELASNAALPIPEFPPDAKRKLAMFAAAVGLASAAFWAVILTAPPQTAAAQPQTVPVFEMMRNAPLDLAGLEADAI